MNKEKLLTLIQSPYITEKATSVGSLNQVVFKVDLSASKLEIKKAVELLFEVSVEGVTVINYQGKSKRHGTTKGRRASWKKAYVKLAEGSHLDFIGGD